MHIHTDTRTFSEHRGRKLALELDRDETRYPIALEDTLERMDVVYPANWGT